MTFANPLGFLGLLALPAIVAIHLYHRRFPPLPVAGLHLWGVDTQLHAPGRKRDRLPVTATLLLELLAALILTLVLARPQFGASTAVRHLVVVLDNSASMSSNPPDGPSFRETALSIIEKRMRSLGDRSVISVILTGPRPLMLAGPAFSWDDAKTKLEEWQPRLARHEFGPAWDLAAQLAERTGELMFVTDHIPQGAGSTSRGAKTDGETSEPATSPWPVRMEVVAVGRPLPNIAISAARWAFDSTTAKGDVFLRIDNRASRPAEVLITARAKQSEVFRKTIAIGANDSAPLEVSVPGGLGLLEIKATAPGDGLELDSRVTLVEPQVRTVTYANQLPKEDVAQAFVDRVLKTMPDSQSGSAEKAHLVIGHASELPASRRDLWWLGLGPLDASDEAKKKAVDLADRTPYLIDKRNPLLSGLSMAGIVWGGVQPLTNQASPLITAGPHRLLVQLDGTQTTAYVLNIDLARSNLAESPDWPILLSNLVELRRDNLPGLRQWNYRINEEVRFRLAEGNSDPDGPELKLWHNNQSRPLARTSVIEVPPLDDTGVYEAREEDRVVGRFAVNFFDPAESTLSSLHTAVREPAEPTTAGDFTLDNPYSWLLLLGIVAIIAAVLTDWRVLRPGK